MEFLVGKSDSLQASGGVAGTISRTLRPIVTGGSVVGLKYRDGVMVAADTLVAYGSNARYPKTPRMSKVGDYTVIAASGEYSDFQNITEQMQQAALGDWLEGDGIQLAPAHYASLLARILYAKRCRLDPLWNSVVVAGHKSNRPYLGFVDLYGTYYEDDVVATGLGRYFAMTLLRDSQRNDMSESEAKTLLEECMRILYYRDTRASNRIQIATATAAGIKIEEPMILESNWKLEAFTRPSCDAPLANASW